MLTHTRFIGLASAFVAALALSPAPASAQFGGLVNRAKDKAAQKGTEQAGDKVGPVSPGEQLSDDLLAKVINGATAADRVLAERDRVTAQRDARSKDLSALLDKNASLRDAYATTNGKITDCRSSSFNNLEHARSEKLQEQIRAKQSDPAFIGKMQLVSMKYAKQMGDAQARKDPVALQKAQTDMMKEVLGVDVFAELKKDSVATDAKCGKAPAMPAALLQEDKLRHDVSVADDSIRTLEARAVNVGAQASGLEQLRYMQLKERTLGILNRLNNRGSTKFSDVETAAVQKRKADLEKLTRAL